MAPKCPAPKWQPPHVPVLNSSPVCTWIYQSGAWHGIWFYENSDKSTVFKCLC